MKCAKCGAETVKRTNRTSGVEFTGCSAWPKCTWSYNPPRREIVGSSEAERAAAHEFDDLEAEVMTADCVGGTWDW